MNPRYKRDKSAFPLVRLSTSVSTHCRSSSVFLRCDTETDSDFSPFPNSRKRKSATSVLRFAKQTQVFLRFHRRRGDVSQAKCALSDDLTRVTIEERGVVKTFHTLELKLAIGLSEEVSSLLCRRKFDRTVYGFQLQTKRKSYELASEDAEIRDGWTQMLKLVTEAYSEFRKPNALLRFVQQQCRLKDAKQRLRRNRFNSKLLESRVTGLESQLREANLCIAQLVVRDIVAQVEARDGTAKLPETALTTSRSSGDVPSLERRHSLLSAWKLVIPLLTFAEVYDLRCVSSRFLRLAKSCLCSFPYWTKLSRGGLQPRSVSWPLYCKQFLRSQIPQQTVAISADVSYDIHRDLLRSNPQHAETVERVLFRLCQTYQEVGYCQGMHLITEFLLKTVDRETKAAFVLLRLMNSPYYLSEIWKPGLPRVKLVAYQLEELMQLKLPMLASHLAALDLPLEVLIAPWILTLFTQLTKMPMEVMMHVWDLFLVRGWSAFHAVSLSLLRLSENSVLGKSLEVTMQCFHRDLDVDFSQVSLLYPLFEPEGGLLNDLERRFRHRELRRKERN